MSALRALVSRVTGQFRRRGDSGLDDEMRFHLEMLTLTAVALAAHILPARRALRVDPVIALRQE